MNRARYLRLFIFAIAMFFLLFYPFYVRNSLMEVLPYLVESKCVSEVVIQNIAINKLLIFNSLLIVLFPISLLYIFFLGNFNIGERLLFKRNQVNPNSKKNFQLDKWYDMTRRFLGNDWFVHMYGAIEKGDFVPKKSALTFVSPAANKGIYEKFLYDDLKQKGISIKFIIADIDEIQNHAVKGTNDENLRFFEGKEALKIEEYLLEAGETKADVIFDIKGSIWYSLRSDNEQNILFEKFYRVLSDDGLIIIDNSKKSFLSFCIYYLFGHVSWHVETSTGFLLNRNKKRNSKFKAYIDSHFEQNELRFQNDFGDLFDIIVLKKKILQ
ncbi:hypothetical protein [Clostridium sp. C2-6-12]|uniref:hypothetical protein n=1 Tax=Clostridium sp. C2-6-12 TaxID=2698832 RepID=UPI0013684754|nr:hypothetical protein [Clostridium sp. C2-6-12]